MMNGSYFAALIVWSQFSRGKWEINVVRMGRAANSRPAHPDHVLLWTLVETIGRQPFNRSD